MEEIGIWQKKFEICDYSKKLIDRIKYLNTIVDSPVDITEIEKGLIIPVNITLLKCVNQGSHTILTL
jgi:hypothetical protein